jgi:hypothetical protein
VSGNASPIEILWTVLAAVGVFAGLVTAWLVVRDLHLAYKPPAEVQPPPTAVERRLALWQVVQWLIVAACCLGLLALGWRALGNPPGGAPDAATRAANAAINGVILIGVALGVVILPVGYLVNRWLVLRRSDQAVAAARAADTDTHYRGGTDL